MPTVKKLDLRKELKHLYAPSAKQVEIVEVPPFKFLMLDGMIEPGRAPEDSPSFRAAFGALYGMSFTLKFMSKLNKAKPIDYKIMALEGLWWTEFGEFRVDRKDDLLWTMMMLQPGHINKAMVAEAMQQLKARRSDEFQIVAVREGHQRILREPAGVLAARDDRKTKRLEF